MILRSGEDTREARGPGRYESGSAVASGMAMVLDDAWISGDTGDEYVTHPGEVCEGYARYGRRVLAWDDHGFVSVTRFPNDEYASRVFGEIAAGYAALDDGEE